ncbi:hypothetical protein [Campylobacter hyointestinalis]|uniref:hypothetical protein n=1 Tax=Campylobacter hyointestinalis TaxID=198 RepID=UPI0010FAC6B7|nr:hypothetical protein [Campylobacter hyointestinalis]
MLLYRVLQICYMQRILSQCHTALLATVAPLKSLSDTDFTLLIAKISVKIRLADDADKFRRLSPNSDKSGLVNLNFHSSCFSVAIMPTKSFA